MTAKRKSTALFGVVLHVRAFGESDRIVEVLTVEQGRVSLLARGARASRRRFVGALDLFVSLRMQAVAGPNLWTLSAADIVTARLGIRADLSRIERASRLCECARYLVAEHHAAEVSHGVVCCALDRLDAGDLCGAASAYPALLSESGIMPDLRVCVRCGDANRPLAAYVDPTGSGLWCARCAPDRQLLGQQLKAVLVGEPCTDRVTADAAERLIMACVEAHMGRPLRSRVMT